MGTLSCSRGASRHYAMVVARNVFSIEQNKGHVDDNMRGSHMGGATVFAAGSMQMRDHCGKVCGKVHFTSASNGPRSAVCGGGTAEVWGEKIPVQQQNRMNASACWSLYLGDYIRFSVVFRLRLAPPY